MVIYKDTKISGVLWKDAKIPMALYIDTKIFTVLCSLSGALEVFQPPGGEMKIGPQGGYPHSRTLWQQQQKTATANKRKKIIVSEEIMKH